MENTTVKTFIINEKKIKEYYHNDKDKNIVTKIKNKIEATKIRYINLSEGPKRL